MVSGCCGRQAAKARRDVPQSVAAGSLKGLGQMYGDGKPPWSSSLRVSCICLSTTIIYLTDLSVLNRHWLSDWFASAIDEVNVPLDLNHDFVSDRKLGDVIAV